LGREEKEGRWLDEEFAGYALVMRGLGIRHQGYIKLY
jgi:hypothetical protein